MRLGQCAVEPHAAPDAGALASCRPAARTVVSDPSRLYSHLRTHATGPGVNTCEYMWELHARI